MVRSGDFPFERNVRSGIDEFEVNELPSAGRSNPSLGSYCPPELGSVRTAMLDSTHATCTALIRLADLKDGCAREVSGVGDPASNADPWREHDRRTYPGTSRPHARFSPLTTVNRWPTLACIDGLSRGEAYSDVAQGSFFVRDSRTTDHTEQE